MSPSAPPQYTTDPSTTRPYKLSRATFFDKIGDEWWLRTSNRLNSHAFPATATKFGVTKSAQLATSVVAKCRTLLRETTSQSDADEPLVARMLLPAAHSDDTGECEHFPSETDEVGL